MSPIFVAGLLGLALLVRRAFAGFDAFPLDVAPWHSAAAVWQGMVLMSVGLVAAAARRMLTWWVLPLCFTSAALVGISGGWLGQHIPFIESCLAGALCIMGVIVVVYSQSAAAPMTALASVIGVLLGLLHGSILPPTSPELLSTIGLIFFNLAGLQAAGLLLAFSALMLERSAWARAFGVATAAIGLIAWLVV